MADEPNNSMDELLRSYAEDRRKAPEVPLHPATRNMLQAEVRRVYGPAPAPETSRSSRNWLLRFWPHFAVGVAACAALIVGLVSIDQQSKTKSKQMAANAPQTKVPAPSAQRLAQPAAKDAARPNKDQTLASAAPRNVPTRALDADKAERSVPLREKQMNEKLKQQPASKLAVSASQEKRATGGSLQDTIAQRDRIAPASPPAGAAKPQEPQSDSLAQSGSNTFDKEQAKPTEEKFGLTPDLKKKTHLSVVTEQAPANTQLTFTAATPLPSQNPAVVLQQQTHAVEPKAESLAVNAMTENNNLRAARSFAYQEAPIQNLGAALRTYFVATNAAPVRGQNVPLPVLASFEMEQLGEQVRFIDADGSMYDGSLTEETNSPVLRTFVQTRAANSSERGAFRTPAAPPKAAPAATWNFQATGINQTLGQQIIFKGNLVEPLVPRTDAQLGGTVTLRTEPPITRQSASSLGKPLPRPIINGTANIAGTNQVQLRAVAPARP
jgi:hypothetical protein